ncbi:hypothetical protein DL93DRAFT_1775951 [Clavulina sp. PMI_390]|nr:hypothetical protein DL93DRAFT_1775951 [Clavulina sp. PMI_390]
MAHINALPSELLVEMFESILDDKSVFQATTYTQIFRIIQVCTTWSNVVLSTSKFWSSISCALLRPQGRWTQISESDILSRNRLRIEVLLERSRGSPIDVFVGCSSDDKSLNAVADMFNKMILPHASRLRQLKVIISIMGPIMTIFPIKCPLPMLESISFETTGNAVVRSGALRPISFFEASCSINIKSLITKTPIPTSFEGINLLSLLEFSESWQIWPDHGPIIAPLLESAVHLRRLSIPDLDEVSLQNHLHFPLARLEYLSIRYQHLVYFHAAPNLTMLELLYRGITFPTGPQLRPQDFPELRCLIIQSIGRHNGFPISDLVEIIRRSPSLRVLEIKGINKVDALSLLSLMEEAPVLSLLRLLEISTYSDANTSHSFIDSVTSVVHSLHQSRPSIQVVFDGVRVDGLADIIKDRNVYMKILREVDRLRRGE